MARHLPRLTEGVVYALDHGTLSRGALAMLQPKSPAQDMTAAMQVPRPSAAVHLGLTALCLASRRPGEAPVPAKPSIVHTAR